MSESSEDGDMLAAEYVLGTLEPAEAADVARRLPIEPPLAASVIAWEDRLAPLALLAPPVTPPPDLWTRLERSIGGASSTGAARRPGGVTRSLGFWRATTAIGFALAAGFAAVAFLPRQESRPVAALVPTNGAPAAFVAVRQPDGTLRLTPLEAVPVAADRDLELWALPAGQTRPIPLGVLPAGGNRLAPSAVPSGRTQLLVSLEPRGGSPTGQPTGPVLFGGTISAE